MQIQFPPWKIYLDTCCVGRSLDDQTQDRIQRETEAVETIVSYFSLDQLRWISSEVLAIEAANNPNLKKREAINDRLNFTDETVLVGTIERTRATYLESLGFKLFDALHIACAESGGADVLLTTDDKLLNRATRFRSRLHVRVENPYTWLQEVNENERQRYD